MIVAAASSPPPPPPPPPPRPASPRHLHHRNHQQRHAAAAALSRGRLPSIPTTAAVEEDRKTITVTIYTEALATHSSPNISWATAAAVTLYKEGLFNSYDGPAAVAEVPFGNGYFNNRFACNESGSSAVATASAGRGGAVWSAAQADCWLSNCSAGQIVVPDACVEEGDVVCEHGPRECAIQRWQAFLWTHYLSSGALALQLSLCLTTGAAAAGDDANDLARRCLTEAGVGSDYSRLLNHYYKTFRATETVQYAATVMGSHVKRANVTSPKEWPLVVLSSYDGLKSMSYTGPRTSDGLKSAICKLYVEMKYGPTPPMC